MTESLLSVIRSCYTQLMLVLYRSIILQFSIVIALTQVLPKRNIQIPWIKKLYPITYFWRRKNKHVIQVICQVWVDMPLNLTCVSKQQNDTRDEFQMILGLLQLNLYFFQSEQYLKWGIEMTNYFFNADLNQDWKICLHFLFFFFFLKDYVCLYS